MHRFFGVALFFLSFCLTSRAQIFSDSNLPIVVINTKSGAAIPDEPGIAAYMKIVFRGPGLRNYLSDQNTARYLNYSGNVDIELRGSFSQSLPKRGYGFTTKTPDLLSDENVSILGMPSEHDWVLNSLNYDPSLIRDYVAFNLSRQMGRYASRTVFCEVVVNGDYKGLYLLQEKVKADKNRVNIEKITPNDNSGTALSGGYITKTDKQTGGDPVAWYMSSYVQNNDNNFIHSWPQPQVITIPQQNFIKSVFLNLQSLAASGNASKNNGYPSIIDVPSFVDFMLLNELCSNSDAYRFSTYYSKDRQGKLHAGPIWDMNLTFGNDLFSEGLNRSLNNVWQFSNGNNEGPRYYRDLYNNAQFRCYLARRFNELTRTGAAFHTSNIEALIDSAAAQIGEAIPREQSRWGRIGPHQDTILAMKRWIKERVPWMSSRLGSFSACSNITTPPIVISAINYHPATSIAFPDDNKLEFIRLSNTGVATVDLTGLYLCGSGLVFQFPPGAALPGGKDLYLASDVLAFRQKYGITAYGSFSRNLPNSNYEIVLSDAFGNTIDRVHYYDQQPWPDADGNGRFLLLADKSLDNALASSWIALGENTLSGAEAANETMLELFPNPVIDVLQLRSNLSGTAEILSVWGQMLRKETLTEGESRIDVSGLPAGVYFLRMSTAEGIATRNFIKI